MALGGGGGSDGSVSEWLRHQRMSIATALAEATRHSAPRSPNTGRAREAEEQDVA